MAPEMHCGQQQLCDGPFCPTDADLFACAVLLFFMRTGQQPFQEATAKCKFYRKILRGNLDEFWSLHESQYPAGYFSEEFKQLLNFMLRAQPNLRLVFTDVWFHDWLQASPIPRANVI